MARSLKMVYRNTIDGITKYDIRRLARRGGVKRIAGLVYEETRGCLKVFLEHVIRDAVTYAEHARRKTVAAMDIIYALNRQGRTIYGVDVEKKNKAMTGEERLERNLGLSKQDARRARRILRQQHGPIVFDGALSQQLILLDLKQDQLLTLTNRVWLNDNVINFFIRLVINRSKDESQKPNTAKVVDFLSTHFIARIKNTGITENVRVLDKWLKKANIDLSKLDILFIPVHVSGDHWCLMLINYAAKQFQYYDPLGGPNNEVMRLVQDMFIGKTKGMEGWGKFVYLEGPRQHNGYDCGMFTCTFVDYLSQGVALDFTQSDMPALRLRMVRDIINGRIGWAS